MFSTSHKATKSKIQPTVLIEGYSQDEATVDCEGGYNILKFEK